MTAEQHPNLNSSFVSGATNGEGMRPARSWLLITNLDRKTVSNHTTNVSVGQGV
jgi:hypothetical protein